MVRVLMDEVVGTDYGQLDLWFSDDVEDDGDVQATCSGQVNGVAGAAIPGRIYLNLGRRSGGSSVRIEAHDGVTPCDAEWEDVVEVSTVIGEQGNCGWTSWAGESGAQFVLPPGPHRGRVCARGRDAGDEDELADEVVDCYLVQLWPAPLSRIASCVWVARTPGTGTRRGARTVRDLNAEPTSMRRRKAVADYPHMPRRRWICRDPVTGRSSVRA